MPRTGCKTCGGKKKLLAPVSRFGPWGPSTGQTGPRGPTGPSSPPANSAAVDRAIRGGQDFLIILNLLDQFSARLRAEGRSTIPADVVAAYVRAGKAGSAGPDAERSLIKLIQGSKPYEAIQQRYDRYRRALGQQLAALQTIYQRAGRRFPFLPAPGGLATSGPRSGEKRGASSRTGQVFTPTAPAGRIRSGSISQLISALNEEWQNESLSSFFLLADEITRLAQTAPGLFTADVYNTEPPPPGVGGPPGGSHNPNGLDLHPYPTETILSCLSHQPIRAQTRVEVIQTGIAELPSRGALMTPAEYAAWLERQGTAPTASDPIRRSEELISYERLPAERFDIAAIRDLQTIEADFRARGVEPYVSRAAHLASIAQRVFRDLDVISYNLLVTSSSGRMGSGAPLDVAARMIAIAAQFRAFGSPGAIARAADLERRAELNRFGRLPPAREWWLIRYPVESGDRTLTATGFVRAVGANGEQNLIQRGGGGGTTTAGYRKARLSNRNVAPPRQLAAPDQTSASLSPRFAGLGPHADTLVACAELYPVEPATSASQAFRDLQDAIASGEEEGLVCSLSHRFTRKRIEELTVNGILARLDAVRAQGPLRVAVWVGWTGADRGLVPEDIPPGAIRTALDSTNAPRPLSVAGYIEVVDPIWSAAAYEAAALALRMSQPGSVPPDDGVNGGAIVGLGIEGDAEPMVIFYPRVIARPPPSGQGQRLTCIAGLDECVFYESLAEGSPGYVLTPGTVIQAADDRAVEEGWTAVVVTGPEGGATRGYMRSEILAPAGPPETFAMMRGGAR